MIYSEKEIEHIIEEAVWKVTGRRLPSSETSLLNTDMDIPVVDFLYVFDLLEKELGLSITDILKTADYTVMSPHNLAKEFCRIQSS